MHTSRVTSIGATFVATLAAVMAAACLLSALPAPASAFTDVRVDGSGRLLANAGLAVVRMSIVPDPFDSRRALVSDSVQGVSPGSGCVALSQTTARCSGFNSYRVVGSNASPPGFLGDRIELGIRTINPGSVVTLEGKDTILTNVPMRETIDGGPGFRVGATIEGDTVVYSGRAAADGGVLVRGGDSSLVNDGQNGTEDALIGIEGVAGTNQPDTLVAPLGATTLEFNTGRMDGRGGNDVVQGNSGEDRLLGGDGDDRVIGREGALAPAASGGRRSGARVSQVPVARHDELDCGNGLDTAVMDLQDSEVNCENREIAAVDEGGILSILSRSLRRHRGRVAVRLYCPRSSKTRCRGRLTISDAGRRLGSRRYRLGKRLRGTVRIKVKPGGRGRVLVRARERDSKNRPKTTEKRLRLR